MKLRIGSICGLFISIVFFGCKSEGALPDTQRIKKIISDAPVISPEESLQLFELDEGLTVDLIASEPQVEDPVAIDFDEQGRIWVVEMRGYMPDSTGKGEDQPVGRIKVIWDEDDDGLMEKSKIIIENLVMPRALRLVYGGLLYAEPPNLVFAELNEKDEVVSTQIVDTEYAIGGNVEHQPNALMLGLDNWIYSAKGTKRYRLIDKEWVIENTEFRGQWGLTKDEFGNLFYNNNSNQLLTDLYPPNSLPRDLLRTNSGMGIHAVRNQSVYPIRTTSGNRSTTFSKNSTPVISGILWSVMTN